MNPGGKTHLRRQDRIRLSSSGGEIVRDGNPSQRSLIDVVFDDGGGRRPSGYLCSGGAAKAPKDAPKGRRKIANSDRDGTSVWREARR